MTITANTPDEYIAQVNEDKREAFEKLRRTIKSNMPLGFEECINYKMIGYVIPHALYPKGYHCDPKQPLPFAALASQKNHMSLYFNAAYGDADAEAWLL